MNKIVCDVCGTSYPDTAEQCPICGTAKTDANKTTTGGEAGYAYVKGGRFSHANVRKRNAGNKELPRMVVPAKPDKKKPAPKKEAAPKESAAEQKAKAAEPKKEKKSYSNIILALIAFVLVVAIVLVFCLIVKNALDKMPDPQQTTAATQADEPESTYVACDGIRFALSEKIFGSLEEKFKVTVILSPSNTTEKVWFETSNELVAVVSETGIVTPVGDGQAIIYAHCGDFTAECTITCQVGYTPAPPTEPTTQPTQPSMPDVTLELNRDDFTLDGYGDSWTLYKGELDVTLITWTSSDETVATVKDGKVVAVGNGDAVITAEYNGQVVTCQVHCKNVVVTHYELRTIYGSGKEFALDVGETITLYLIDKETGLRVQAENVTYELSKDGVVKINAKGKITALASGKVYVYLTYAGETYKSTVYVR